MILYPPIPETNTAQRPGFTKRSETPFYNSESFLLKLTEMHQSSNGKLCVNVGMYKPSSGENAA